MDVDPAPPPRFTRALQALLVVAFLAGIVTPGVSLLLDPESQAAREAILRETRKPAQAPELPRDLASLDAFPARFEAWFNDFMGQRATLIRWHNALKLLVFGVSPSDTVLLGRDGWMFYNHPESIAEYRGLRPFSEAELDAWQAALEQRASWLAARNCRYLFVVGPSKHTIYPEKMVDAQTQLTATRRLDQLLERLRTRSKVATLDLRPALLAAKSDALLYYPHGTHWNPLGGYYAYAAIMSAFAKDDPRFAPKPIEAFRLREQNGLADSWARKLHLGDLVTHEYTTVYYTGPNKAALVEAPHLSRYWEAYTTTADGSGGQLRGMLWRDSFGDNIRKLLALNFSRFTVGVNGRCPPEELAMAVMREQPQVLIDELVERALLDPPPEPLPGNPRAR
ncbi:MAG: hypothetical protein DHS20C15_06360 [Planctomycetota bacterium]|nr:MAG: hypothetical protein DHS20C15_06360 [Planctomycetota bacterium]